MGLSEKIEKYQAIQAFLQQEASELGFTELRVDIDDLNETIETMHSVVLE